MNKAKQIAAIVAKALPLTEKELAAVESALNSRTGQLKAQVPADMKLIDIGYYVALGVLLGLAIHLLFREAPEPPEVKPAWDEIGYKLYRQPVGGGWLYKDGTNGDITFVPEVIK